MDQYMESDQNEDQAVQNNSTEVRSSDRADQDDRAMYRLDPRTSGIELRKEPHPNDRIDQPIGVLSRPSRQGKTNSRARLNLSREDSQNDHDFSLLVYLVRTKCPEDRTDGLSLMSDALLDFYHSDFYKARIIKLSEDLGSISALLDHPVDCPDRPVYVQLLSATEPTWSDEPGHQPKGHFDQI
ncbi:hypothetical protein F2Q69_00012755 [Brassica cretica]|uniref:Uncharacterized protein n=1 Tax=Brassica cretica TaxID=69181 RepID=A0A8S9R8T4_BRACR|nr:hypothetical protein F2Q69_00012755 [Brassica cretica]